MNNEEKLEFYSKSDSDKILKYHKNKIENVIFGQAIKLRVLNLERKSISNDKFRVYVKGYLPAQQNIEFEQDIKSFCQQNGLKLPSDIINNQDLF